MNEPFRCSKKRTNSFFTTTKWFVHLLGEFDDTKSPFETNWPLILSSFSFFNRRSSLLSFGRPQLINCFFVMSRGTLLYLLFMTSVLLKGISFTSETRNWTRTNYGSLLHSSISLHCWAYNHNYQQANHFLTFLRLCFQKYFKEYFNRKDFD